VSQRGGAARVHEPTTFGPRPAVVHDWRGQGLAPELEAARAMARQAVGRAVSADTPVAWASAELATFRCLDLALDRLYAARGVPRPAADALVEELMAHDAALGGRTARALTAPDARTRYVFVEDLLAGG
jgi:hypothetical protein